MEKNGGEFVPVYQIRWPAWRCRSACSPRCPATMPPHCCLCMHCCSCDPAGSCRSSTWAVHLRVRGSLMPPPCCRPAALPRVVALPGQHPLRKARQIACSCCACCATGTSSRDCGKPGRRGTGQAGQQHMRGSHSKEACWEARATTHTVLQLSHGRAWRGCRSACAAALAPPAPPLLQLHPPDHLPTHPPTCRMRATSASPMAASRGAASCSTTSRSNSGWPCNT